MLNISFCGENQQNLRTVFSTGYLACRAVQRAFYGKLYSLPAANHRLLFHSLYSSSSTPAGSLQQDTYTDPAEWQSDMVGFDSSVENQVR